MTVLDAYAVVAYLQDEAAADQVEPLLFDGRGARLTATGLGEVIDRLVRIDGADEDQVELDLADLGLLDAVSIDASIGMAAGRLRARHYHRNRRSVSMADCQLAAAAQRLGEPLATSDPALLELCQAEGIEVIVLPGSDGTRWTPTR